MNPFLLDKFIALWGVGIGAGLFIISVPITALSNKFIHPNSNFRIGFGFRLERVATIIGYGGYVLILLSSAFFLWMAALKEFQAAVLWSGAVGIMLFILAIPLEVCGAKLHIEGYEKLAIRIAYLGQGLICITAGVILWGMITSGGSSRPPWLPR